MGRIRSLLPGQHRAAGTSGLGLEAQQAAVRAFVGERPLIAEHTDIESGKYAERPALLRALAEARNANAILVIAKLDRLARNVAFIANLMESGVRFVAVDMPEANRLTTPDASSAWAVSPLSASGIPLMFSL